MEQTNDNLVKCNRCESNACYEVQVSSEIKSWSCLGCGYWSNSLMKEDNEFWKEQLEILPNLYKELAVEDENGHIWVPNYTVEKGKGVVFMNGTKADNAKWAAVKAEDMKDGKWKEDKIVYFEERDYMDALSFINILP